jgi:ribulose-5-phosphate 4-epimerase/fuculose-1-phosphate aldolase
MADDAEEIRRKVALSCRILGVEVGSGGHSSARVPGTDQMMLRCRGGGGEGSLANTDMHHVRLVDFDGEGPGLGAKHFSPHETPLHGEIYRALPDVGGVVHIHPMYAMLCGVTNVEFKPVFAAFNPGLLRIALEGVPMYPRAATVIDQEMAGDMIEAMDGRDILQLRGHGIVATGKTIEAATSLAVRFESLAKIMWQIALSGREPIEIMQEDKDRYDPHSTNRPVFPASRDWQQLMGGEEGMGGWGSYVRKVEREVGLPAEEV